MTLNVPLSPEIEAKLLRHAALLGTLPERIVQEAIEEKLGNSGEAAPTFSNAEWHRRFDALIASMPRGNLDADLSRHSAYDQQGL